MLFLISLIHSQFQVGYISLLRRYLNIKYAAQDEADDAFHKLLANIEEVRTLSVDVINFFAKYGTEHAEHASESTKPEVSAIVQR